MNGQRLFSGAIAATILLAAGCGKESQRAPAVGHDLPSPRITAGEPGQPGGRLTLAVSGTPDTFNPVLSTKQASDEVLRLLFAPLVSIDYATQELTPALAESWSVAPDGKTWTFKLRPGLHWSDGHPLTAADVVFTWSEVMANPDINRAGSDIFLVNGKKVAVTKVDDLTVQMVTPGVFAPFLELFGCGIINSFPLTTGNRVRIASSAPDHFG
jgi:peptide/nickel transport system substrate-binding protein